MNLYIRANSIFARFGRDYLALKKDLPIRPSEMGVLNIITNHEGPQTPIMIAQLLGVSKPMIAAHISVLEKKGYIYRDYSPEDKRSFYVRLTEKGTDLVVQAEKKQSEQLSAIEKRLGKERFTQLVDLLGEAEEVIAEDLLHNNK